MGSQSGIPYGPVFVTDGPHAGRIGLYDDDDTIFSDEVSDDAGGGEGDEAPGEDVAIVYFGTMELELGSYDIPLDYLRPVTMEDLVTRREQLDLKCSVYWNRFHPEEQLEEEQRLDLLYELHFVESELVARLISARYVKTGKGERIFISHSSKDKEFARWLWSDLKAAGYEPWIDEDQIVVGQSIPHRISDGLEKSSFLVVILSQHAVGSRWVEREWHAKYWSEVESGATLVLPVLYQDCTIPEFLKTKKYANFTLIYSNGLTDLLFAIHKLTETPADDV